MRLVNVCKQPLAMKTFYDFVLDDSEFKLIDAFRTIPEGGFSKCVRVPTLKIKLMKMFGVIIFYLEINRERDTHTVGTSISAITV